MKKWKIHVIYGLFFGVLAVQTGCLRKTDYGTEYNYETDCQYSYANSVTSWKKIQSDGTRDYLLKNEFIYQYNSETGSFAPLCSRTNCLHDMETDPERLQDCNAYAPVSEEAGAKYIQYYEGCIYYVNGGSLYRLRKDGSRKDKMFTTDDDMPIYNWLIHRGYFYFETEPYYYGENKDLQVYKKCALKAAALSSRMKERKAQLIYESDEEHNLYSFGPLKAYGNYLYYGVGANQNDYEFDNLEGWLRQSYDKNYLYNIETGESREISMPEGFSDTTAVSDVVFLKDRMLIRIYDDLEDVSHKFPIYSVNYDLTDLKVWMEGVEQDKLVQSYGDYVIITDADIIYEKSESADHCHVEIYLADGEKISCFTYPMNVLGNFNGFGPDGVNLEFSENEENWFVHALRFEDALDHKGETVDLQTVAERSFGTLYREE